MRSLHRLARHTVPLHWRETVDRDLADEARRRGLTGGRAEVWIALRLIPIGAAFRWRGAGGRRRLTWTRAWDRIGVDLRHTWSSTRARPGAFVGTVAILTLGVGLTTTIFALADPFLLRPLPYGNPSRLARIQLIPAADAPQFSTVVGPDVPTLADWRRRADLFEDVAAIDGGFERVRLLSPGGAALLYVSSVSPNFLTMLTGAPLMAPSPLTDRELGVRSLVVTDSLARTRLGLEPTAAPFMLRTDDGATVALLPDIPADFVFPSTSSVRPDALSPVAFGGVVWPKGNSRGSLIAIVRLRSGVSPASVKAALDGGLASSKLHLDVEWLGTAMSSSVRSLALGALTSALMIAIVCTANVMNLVVARGVHRARDFATRQALGASRLDLLQLLVLELSAVGAVSVIASLVVTNAGLGVIAGVMPAQYMVFGRPAITGRVVAFAVGLMAMVVIACTVPAWLSVHAPATPPGGGEPRTVRRWRFLLATGQTAVAMVLVLGATFLVRSYANLWLQGTGYSRDAHLVTASYPASRTIPQMMDTLATTMTTLRHIPGVTNVAAGALVGPLIDQRGGAGGPIVRAGSQTAMILPSQVTAGYFDVVGTPIIAGRAIEDGDRAWEAVVVNERLARRFWPGLTTAQVVGQPITGNGQPGRVVGVVRDAHDRALDIAPAPRIYKPFDVELNIRDLSFSGRLVTFALRVVPDAPVPAAAIREAVLAVDADAIVEPADALYGRLAETIRDRTFATIVLGLFGIAAVGVSTTGIFAVVAFVAARRTREIAIRIALGASGAHVRAVVIRDALVAALAGAATGLVAGRWLLKAIESQLYGVTADDWLTQASAVAGFATIAVVAAWWPTRRALRLDPNVALRVE